eukprot:2504232-Lingulodinium_polyedra.AAC.1
MLPQALEGVATELGGRVLAPEQAARVASTGTSVIDFGIASRAFADGLVRCEVVLAVGALPRRPV